MWHKLELYRAASGVLDSAISSLDESVHDTSCLIYYPALVADDAWGQKEVKYNYVFNEDGSADFKIRDRTYGKLNSSWHRFSRGI